MGRGNLKENESRWRKLPPWLVNLLVGVGILTQVGADAFTAWANDDDSDDRDEQATTVLGYEQSDSDVVIPDPNEITPPPDDGPDKDPGADKSRSNANSLEQFRSLLEQDIQGRTFYIVDVPMGDDGTFNTMVYDYNRNLVKDPQFLQGKKLVGKPTSPFMYDYPTTKVVIGSAELPDEVVIREFEVLSDSNDGGVVRVAMLNEPGSGGGLQSQIDLNEGPDGPEPQDGGNGDDEPKPEPQGTPVAQAIESSSSREINYSRMDAGQAIELLTKIPNLDASGFVENIDSYSFYQAEADATTILLIGDENGVVKYAFYKDGDGWAKVDEKQLSSVASGDLSGLEMAAPGATEVKALNDSVGGLLEKMDEGQIYSMISSSDSGRVQIFLTEVNRNDKFTEILQDPEFNNRLEAAIVCTAMLESNIALPDGGCMDVMKDIDKYIAMVAEYPVTLRKIEVLEQQDASLGDETITLKEYLDRGLDIVLLGKNFENMDGHLVNRAVDATKQFVIDKDGRPVYLYHYEPAETSLPGELNFAQGVYFATLNTLCKNVNNTNEVHKELREFLYGPWFDFKTMSIREDKFN